MQAPLNILRLIRCYERLQVKSIPKHCRTYLSQAYHCEDEWNKRLESSLLKQVKPMELFFDIERKFQIDGRISAVDVDIFSNVVQDESGDEELMSLLQKLRTTTEASNILPSTHHAVVKFFLKYDKIEKLFEILNNRIKYGIFPDAVCYNLMMDKFIKKKDFISAAKVATLLMLQEDYENPISNAMVLYSCHKYLEDPDGWKAPVIIKDEPEEEVKVRVRYIREPYFDDHFDLTEPSDLVGKTLSVFGKHCGNTEGRSCQLRGLILFKKYVQANELMQKWLSDNTPDVVFKEVISLIKKDVAKIFEGEMTDDVKKLKESLDKLSDLKLKEGSLTEVLESNIKTAIEKQENIDITQQCKDYKDWEETRLKVLKNHLAELDKQQKKQQFAKIKADLEYREKILTFFDKEEEIELKIEEKEAKWQQMYGHIKIKDSDVIEDYIPPDVKKRREL